MAWQTDDEYSFLRGLGTYTEAARKTPRVEWLTRYLEAAPRRHDWGLMDRNGVLAYAKAEWEQAVKQAVRKEAIGRR